MPQLSNCFKATVLGFAILLLFACDSSGKSQETASAESNQVHQELDELLRDTGLPPYQGDLAELRKRKVLRALVTYSRTDFFIENGRIRGIQAEFLKAFEDELNKGIKNPAEMIRVQFVPVTFDRLLPSLEQGYGDIAAAFLTVTPERQKRVDFATGQNLSVNEILVANKKSAAVSNLAALSGQPLYVLRGSSYAEHLRRINQGWQAEKRAPMLIEEADSRLLSEDILELVNAGVVPYTVVDDYRAKQWAQVLPNLRLNDSVVINADGRVGWAVRKNSPQLLKALNGFIKKQGKGTLLGNMLFTRYFQNPQWIKNPTTEQDRDRLQKFIHLFEKYGDEYGFEPLALAAQAYQESGLDPKRKSHRGAVGLMQLLPSTASDKNIAVKNIDKTENNVLAAARYLAFIRDRYLSDAELSETNRQAMIWAAYNAGPAKLRKMRELAKKMGLDPNIWRGNVEMAAARLVGRETVEYVANIQKYYVAYTLAQHMQGLKQDALQQVQ